MNLMNPLLVIGLAALPASAVSAISASTRDGADDAKARKDAGAAALVQQLGDKDYKTRKEAFRALEKLGAEARAELEKAAKSDDAEVRWSASLLLDRLDENDESNDESSKGSARGGLREMQDDGDQADPNDPFATPFRRFRSLRTPEDATQEMREAMRRIEEWQENFQDRQPGWFHDNPFGFRMFDDPFRGFDFGRAFDGQGGFGGTLELGPGSSFSRTTENDGKRESLSVRVDENGRVTVDQEKDGETKHFEADSLEALRKEHPELLEDLDGGGGMRFHVRPFARDPKADPLSPNEMRPRARARNWLEKPKAAPAPKDQPKADPNDAPPAPANRPRLGVQVTPVSPDVARYLELEEGVGLEVASVLEDSAAQKLGIKARDVIIEVNGRTIRGVEDVVEALGDQDPATAEVTVLRRGEEKSLERRSK